MRAHMLLEPGTVVFREHPVPKPGEGEVVIRVRCALTCGTDLKMFLRGHPKFPTPTLFGHEFSGEVAAVGPGVYHVREGDSVMAAPTGPCGACYYCQREQENLCETVIETMVLGAYGEYVKLHARAVRANLYPKPAHLSFAAAALLEPLSCVMHGLESVPLRNDDHVLLIGAGAISLLHLLVLKTRGVRSVWVLGRSRQRTQYAERLGAERVLATDLDTTRQLLQEATEGRGADLVIECTGQVEVWQAAPQLARRGGTVILFGGCAAGTEVRWDTHRLHYEQLTVRSPFHFTPRAVRKAYEILCEPSFPAHRLISGFYPLPELPRALQAHREAAGIKFAIEP